jgi:hypothetical protein
VYICVENRGFGTIRLWAKVRGLVEAVVAEQAGASKWLGIAVITGGEIARSTWWVKDRWGAVVLLAGSSSRGVEAMGTWGSLACLADFGAGGATKNLTRTRDNDRCVHIISGIWHRMFQVIDN